MGISADDIMAIYILSVFGAALLFIYLGTMD